MCAAAAKAALDEAFRVLSPVTGTMRDWDGSTPVQSMPLFVPPEGAFDLTDMVGAFWRAGKSGTGFLPTIVIPGDEGEEHNTLDRLALGEAERGGCAHFTKIHSSKADGTRTRACQHGPMHPTAVKPEIMVDAEAQAAQPVPREDRKRGAAKLHGESVKGAWLSCGCFACLYRFVFAAHHSRRAPA